ncbi:MAG: TRAP transporter small permease [Alphaproteobacteria bacterium]
MTPIADTPETQMTGAPPPSPSFPPGTPLGSAYRAFYAMAAFNGVMCAIGRWLAAILLMFMVGIVLVQIFFRYGLNDSLTWTEQVAKTMMVWLTLLVAPWAWRAGAQIRVTLFHDALPPRARALLDLVLTVLALWLISILFLEGADLIERGRNVRAAAVPVPTAVFYAILPPAFVALFLVGAEQLLGAVIELITGRAPHLEDRDGLDRHGPDRPSKSGDTPAEGRPCP